MVKVRPEAHYYSSSKLASQRVLIAAGVLNEAASRVAILGIFQSPRCDMIISWSRLSLLRPEGGMESH